jgi:hypothetical protein
MVVLSVDVLKAFTGEFDLATVVHLKMRGREIPRLECLEKLEGLRWLDLGKNSIQRIENLSCLTKLEVLDLSHNKISSIPEMKVLTLKRLHLQGNPIRAPTDLAGLRSIPQLQYLWLQNVDGSDACPVCANAKEYTATVRVLLPELYSLDSQRKHLPTLDFDGTGADTDIDVPTPSPWFTADELANLEAELEDQEALDRALLPQLDAFDKAMAEGEELLARSEGALVAFEEAHRKADPAPA